jgi:hypothetical protein
MSAIAIPSLSSITNRNIAFPSPSISSFAVDCQGSLLPQLGPLIHSFRSIGSIPGQLEAYATSLHFQLPSLGIIESDIESYVGKYRSQALGLRNTLEGLLQAIGTESVSSIIKIPELDWEYAARSLVSDYKIYVQLKMLALIDSILPTGFLSLPIPFLSGFTIQDLLSPTGRLRIKSSILSKIPSFGSDCIDHLFTGKFSLNIPEFHAHEVFQHIMLKVQELLTNTLFTVFTSLISKFQSIWDALQLPSIPTFAAFDVNSIILGMIQSAEKSATNQLNGLINSVLGIGIPILGNVQSLLNFPDESLYKIRSAEARLASIIYGAKDLAIKMPMYLLETWLAKITDFLKAIGLSSLLQYIPFTFCSFLNLVAAPVMNLGSSSSSSSNSVIIGNIISFSGEPQIKLVPPQPIAPSDSAPGTFLATATADLLAPVGFKILPAVGKFQVANGIVQAGPIPFDYSVSPTEIFKIRGDSADGQTAIEQTFSVNVGPPGAPTTYDMNFISNSYFQSALTDVVYTQSASTTANNNNGTTSSFGPNVPRRTDLGLWVSGSNSSYIGHYSMDVSAWSLANGPHTWANPSRTVLATSSTGFTPIRYGSDNNISGGIYAGQMEPVATSDVLLMKIRTQEVVANTGVLILGRTSGPVGDGFSIAICNNLTPIPNVVVIDAHTVYQGYVQNADGTTDLSFLYTVPASVSTLEFGINSALADHTKPVDVHGIQVTRGSASQPWLATAGASITRFSDTIQLNNSALTGPSGWVGLEIQEIDYSTIAGSLLKIGAVDVLKGEKPTQVSSHGSTATLGMGGLRGIVRMCYTWDPTGWTLYANDSKVVTSNTNPAPTGLVSLLSGTTGRIRRISGGVTRISDAEALRWSSLVNRNFVNPADALTIGVAHQTFYDDFDTNTLMHRSSWPAVGTPGTNNYVGPDISSLYAPDFIANPTHRWKPRNFFHQWDASGSGANEINNEPQHYRDYDFVGNAANSHVITNSCLELHAARTAALTAGEIAVVPTDPHISAQFKYVSAMVTTYGNNSDGGFNQLGGVWNVRAKLPAFKGSWGALWFYNINTSEYDMTEYYGANPTQDTSALHSRNFIFNNGGPVDVGFVVGNDYHDWTAVHDIANQQVRKYFDGKLLKVHPTETAFDQSPWYILMNLAIQPGVFDSTTDTALDAGQGVVYVDRVKVLQFGVS